MRQEPDGPERDAYAQAGVSIERGDAFIHAIKPLARSTARPGSNPHLGGFGGLFDLAACGFRDPVLVAATDGVGTKLVLGIETGKVHGLGIDLVAMCVNDLVVQGATPLFFLDYLATARLDVEEATEVIAGIADGCRQAGCALIGGETAEMPGVYDPGDFDLAGFAVGAVEREAILPRDVASGDRLLGLASSGLHANGYSLVRRLIVETGRGIDGAFLEPTRIYVRACLDAIGTGHVKALAHITGGGLTENIPRVLGQGQVARIDARCWPLLDDFRWLAEAGKLTTRELARTFNCGIGMVVVVAVEHSDKVKNLLEAAGETVHEIGSIVPASDAAAAPLVEIIDAEASWPCVAQRS